VFLSLSKLMLGQRLKLDYGRFLPYPFQFIIQQQPVRCYTARHADSVVKKPLSNSKHKKEHYYFGK
jgi:hypothetical protein